MRYGLLVVALAGCGRANFDLLPRCDSAVGSDAATRPLEFVQANSISAGASSGAIDLAFPLDQTAGDTNVVVLRWGSASTALTALSDQAGNHYVSALAQADTQEQQAVFFATNIAAGPQNVVHAQFTTFETVTMIVLEYGGVASTNPLDQTASNAGVNPTPATVSGLTTTHSHDVLIAAASSASTLNGVVAGYTTRVNLGASVVQDLEVTRADTYSATVDGSTGDFWLMGMIALRLDQ